MSTYKDPAHVLGFVACESLDLAGSLYQALEGASNTITALVPSEQNPKRRMVLNKIANDIQAKLVSWNNLLVTLALAAQRAVDDVEIDAMAKQYADRMCGGWR
jgi:uncharacterized membrane protein YgcG